MSTSAPLFVDPKFDALRNAIYHTERRAHFDYLNKSINFLIIMFGAAAVAKSVDVFKSNSLFIELSILFISTIQLVFDFGGKTRTHEFLQKKYYELLSNIEEDNNYSKNINKWSAKLLIIAADEPMPMRALDALAYNKAVDAIVSDPIERSRYRQKVRWHQRRLRQFVAFQSVDFLNNPNIFQRLAASLRLQDRHKK